MFYTFELVLVAKLNRILARKGNPVQIGGCTRSCKFLWNSKLYNTVISRKSPLPAYVPATDAPKSGVGRPATGGASQKTCQSRWVIYFSNVFGLKAGWFLSRVLFFNSYIAAVAQYAEGVIYISYIAKKQRFSFLPGNLLPWLAYAFLYGAGSRMRVR